MDGQRSLEGKHVVIIGGTSGLGLAGARACVGAGASVVVVGRDTAKLASAAEELGERTACLQGDATEPDSARRAIEKSISEFGGFDALYHVAGGSGRRWGDGALHEITDEAWEKTLALNLTSVFYSNRAALEAFLARGGGGAILNMTSVLGYSPSARFFTTHAYATAKAAIIGMTRSAAARYAGEGIRVNAIAPALVETPMAERAASDEAIMEYIKAKQPLDGGRIGAPTDLDAAVVYFLSDGAKFLTGQVLGVDGGWSVSESERSPS